jgi:hypothetical protein
MDLLDMKSVDELKEAYRGWVDEALEKQAPGRQPRWTESIAVGSESFVRDTKERLGIKAIGREVIGSNGIYELREPGVSYNANFDPENGDLRHENAFYWDISVEKSMS